MTAKRLWSGPWEKMQKVDVHLPELIARLRALMLEAPPGVPFVRIEWLMPVLNLLPWLARQKQVRRMYWRDREGDLEVAALGYCWERQVQNREELSDVMAEAELLLKQSGCHASGSRYLAYVSFSDARHMTWPSFGYGRLHLPVLEMTQTRKGATLGCHLRGNDRAEWQASIHAALEQLHQICWSFDDEESRYQLLPSEQQPTEQGWQQLIGQATHAFQQGGMQKVVLSRQSLMSVSGSVNPWRLLAQWKMANPRSYVYAIESDTGDLFFGCSPERLFLRQDRVLYTEALAGTAPRGRNQEEDRWLEQGLLSDRKNIHENRLVLKDIRNRLAPLCESLEAERSHSVVKLKSIQHLRYLIRGVLNKEMPDGQLLELLHPTPAVGGSPRGEAMNFIEQFEGYSRGLYAGVCGMIAPDKTELSVSIRSALLEASETGVKAQQLLLFAGAGIVQGSDASDEWQELNNKTATISSLLRAGERQSVSSIPDSITHCDPIHEVSNPTPQP